VIRSGIALVLLVAAACGSRAHDTRDDDCARAIARIERIHEQNRLPATSEAVRARLVESCRTHPKAKYDPVLRCAMDLPSDEAAAACIDQGMREVLKLGSGGGSGLNPLLP
jgi:hypothetical protein